MVLFPSRKVGAPNNEGAAIHTATRDSQRQGNQITYIYCEPDGAVQRLYQKLGFVLAAELVTRSFC